MAGSRRLDPSAIVALLRRRWGNGHRRWLDGDGSWPLNVLLGAPTERETARDLAGVRSWVEGWTAAEADPELPGELIWTERHWPGLGRQRLPERLLLSEPGQIAVWIGEHGRWLLARERAGALRVALEPAAGAAHPGCQTQTAHEPDRSDSPSGPVEDATPAADSRSGVLRPSGWGDADPDLGHDHGRGHDADPDFDPDFDVVVANAPALRLGRHFEWLAGAPAADFERLLAVLRWLIANPDSGLYIRQLPIPGIDTKWIGANRRRLVDLLAQHHRLRADQQDARDTDLHRLAGLRREPDLMRLRILDPALRTAAGGLGDITAPVGQLAALPLDPDRVFIVENLQTGLAFDDLPGAVCFMARGYAVDAFAAIPWLQQRPCHYWGDLDTHGFAILNRLRQFLPDAQSLLMDEDTLLAHRDLWQREDKPAAGPLERLTPAERAVFDGLLADRWGERVRLEQERVAWDHAWAQISGTLDRSPGGRRGP